MFPVLSTTEIVLFQLKVMFAASVLEISFQSFSDGEAAVVYWNNFVPV